MARTNSLNTNKKAVVALKNLENLSRFIKLQLQEKGLLEINEIKHDGRGRPKHEYVLTGKGRGLVALSKNWK